MERRVSDVRRRSGAPVRSSHRPPRPRGVVRSRGQGDAVDVSNPLRAVAPGVESDVLAVLLRSHVPMTGARVAAMAARSETQVRVVLRRLEQDGLVEAERHGQSYSYVLNRQHILVPGLEQIYQAMPALDDRIRVLFRRGSRLLRRWSSSGQRHAVMATPTATSTSFSSGTARSTRMMRPGQSNATVWLETSSAGRATPCRSSISPSQNWQRPFDATSLSSALCGLTVSSSLGKIRSCRGRGEWREGRETRWRRSPAPTRGHASRPPRCT